MGLNILMAFFAMLPAHAKDSSCSAKMKAGDVCLGRLSLIHPTQFDVGMREVRRKQSNIESNMEELSEKKFDEYLEAKAVKVVLGPGGQIYAIDGHHFALAAVRAGLREAYFLVKKDYSKGYTEKEFWEKMADEKLVFQYSKGEGPLKPSELPRRLDGMGDDPYRSLASEVRRRGGFEKEMTNYSEFAWAGFFRERVKIGSSDEDFERAVDTAIVLARSVLAEDMPGHIEDGDCRDILSGKKKK
jgi:hypothetical protein